MDNIEQVSKHKLLTLDRYTTKGRLKSIIIVWAITLILFAVTQIPGTRYALQDLAYNTLHLAETNGVMDFIFNGLWVLFIPWTIFTIITLRKNQGFDTLNVYKEGVGFEKDNKETFASYDDIQLDMASMGKAFSVQCKSVGISSSSYVWKEFEAHDVLTYLSKKSLTSKVGGMNCVPCHLLNT